MVTAPRVEPGAWGYEVRRSPRTGLLQFVARPGRVADLLDAARRWGDRIHLSQEERQVSFAHHRDLVLAEAARLRRHGVEPGDRVALTGHASADWVIAFWATQVVGGIAVPCSPWWDSRTLEDVVEQTTPRLVWRAGWDRDDVDSSPGAAAQVGEGAPALILFTAGTTGSSKPVVLSQRAVIAGLQSMLAARRMLPPDLHRDRPGPVSLMTLPLFHIGGISTMAANLLCGGTMVFLGGRFDPAAASRLIAAHGVTTWGAIPTMVRRVVEHAERTGRTLPSLRTLLIGGAPVPDELLARAHAVFPSIKARPGNTYGMTEAAGHVATATGEEVLQRPGTSGRALPTMELRIVPHPAGDDRTGEIQVRSPSLLSGYWGSTMSPITADGWLATGDLGHIDDDGYLHVTGRAKDVIIRGGENIAASEVEQILLQHPAVREAAAVGLPDPDLGQQVGAAVVTSGAAEADLERWVIDRLPSYARPTRWWLRTDDLPINRVGKVRKDVLLARWPNDGSPV